MPIPVGSPAPPTTGVIGPGTPGARINNRLALLGDVEIGMTDDYGVEWILESLSGWSDAPPTTGGINQRSGDHGGWYPPAFYAPRLVEVEGRLIANSWAAASAACNRLMASIPLDIPDWLSVVEGDDTLCAQVRQEGDPLVARKGAWAKFSFSLLAADPRRYSPIETTASTGLPQTTGGLSLPLVLPLAVGATVTSGVLSATNEGNMNAPVVFTVYGPTPPFAITHLASGKTIRFAESIGAGRFLAIDTDRRRALLDGTAGRVVTGTWFDYEPGVNEISFSAATYDSGALLVSSHRSAWR